MAFNVIGQGLAVQMIGLEEKVEQSLHPVPVSLDRKAWLVDELLSSSVMKGAATHTSLSDGVGSS